MKRKLLVLVPACVLPVVLCLYVFSAVRSHNAIQADAVVLSHETATGDVTASRKITDPQTLDTLLAMHDALKTEETSRPMGARMAVTFYLDGKETAHWRVSPDGVTCGTVFGIGNHLIRGVFDYAALEALLANG